MPVPDPPAEPTLCQDFGRIIDALCRLCFARMGPRHPLLPLMALLHRRFRLVQRRFNRLAALLQAGRLPPPRARSSPPRAAAPPEATPARRPSRYPRGLAWLCALIPHEAAACGAHLQHLLRQPEAAALLAAAPQLLRYLRPICRMLGHDIVPTLRPPRRPRPPRSEAAAARAAAPRPMPLHRLRRLILAGVAVPRALVLPDAGDAAAARESAPAPEAVAKPA